MDTTDAGLASVADLCSAVTRWCAPSAGSGVRARWPGDARADVPGLAGVRRIRVVGRGLGARRGRPPAPALQRVAFPQAAADVATAIEQARDLDDVDPDRVGLWCFSLGGPLAVDWMRAAPPWLRCLVWTYPVLAPPPDWAGDIPRFDAIGGLAASPGLPKLLVRVEKELPPFVPNQDAFVNAARTQGAALEVIDIPDVVHGFEGLDDYPEHARTAVHHAMSWAVTALRS